MTRTRTPLPPEYGRVTSPERYAALHQVALDLLDELEREFYVTRDEDLEPVSSHVGHALVRPTVNLRPASGGSTVSVSFTSFPGVFLRVGEWTVNAYPACGCDACDEDPEEVAEQFVEDVLEAVDGRLVERVERRFGRIHETKWPAWTRP